MGSHPTSHSPEILPPQDARAPQPPRPRRRWSPIPATYLLVGVNCAVYLLMVMRGVSPWGPSVYQLMHYGADNAGSVLIEGQWWRIISAMFVHVGILHLATNMWCLWNLGLLAEPLMDWFGVVAVYILTGAAGNLLSTWSNWVRPIHDASGAAFFPAGAGASGAVFGIAGALIVLLKSKRLPIPQYELKRLRKSVIYFAAINLVIGLGLNFGSGFTGVEIDNSAHIGGFLCGLLFAVPLVPRIGSPRTEFTGRMRLAVGAIVILLVLFGFYVAHIPPPQGLMPPPGRAI
ncbi:MAG: rhomboid family intramembrane serine protease [Terracidiphilus sp.]